MPWCPRCDEIFPEGPACPRCSTRLIDRERGGLPEELQAVPELPMIKVSRRDRRALERLSGPKAPSSRVLAAAVAALVFAVGFLLGRLGSIETAGPSVRALPAAEALSALDVDGSVAYLLWTQEPLATIAVHALSAGDVVPRARFTPPFDPSYEAETWVVSLDGSVALVVGDDTRSFVAFAPAGGPSHGWVPGVEAAWASSTELLVRQKDGSVFEWSARAGDVRERRWGRADRLFQTKDGAVVERSNTLEPIGIEQKGLDLPIDGYEGGVLGTDGKRVLFGGTRPAIWNGRSAENIRVEGFRAVSGSFEPSGDRAAFVLRRGAELTVAVVDDNGHAALKPLGARASACTPVLTWDRAGSWIYVAPGDGVLYVVEASGGHVEQVRTHGVGCGLAWIS